MRSNPQVENSAKVEHAPGPWKTEQNANSIDIIAADGTVVAILINEDDLEITAAMKGNAAALVAVPDMMAALKSIRDARDYFAENGSYPKDTISRTGKYQCFDDWAADLADIEIAKAGGK